MREPDQLLEALAEWEGRQEDLPCTIQRAPIQLVHLKGFDESGMPHRVDFSRQYLVWEVKFREVNQSK